MSSLALFSNRIFTFIAALMATVFVLASCQSSEKSDPSATNSDPASTAGLTPGTKLFSRRDLDGAAYTVDGKSTKAQAIVLDGESRRPLFVSADQLIFAKRRSELDRWQVFEADLSKETERRVSFDAGDAEPVANVDARLIIATSSDLVKSSERVLKDYKRRFLNKDAATASELVSEAPQHLLIEKPASGQRGTEWVQMSRDPAAHWRISFDRAAKTGIALLYPASAATQPTASVFKVSITEARKNKTEIRTWQPLRVRAPQGRTPSDSGDRTASHIIDGHILPDGLRAVWSDGARLWTTNLQGLDARSVGDTVFPGTNQLTVDPSGRWIVFSTPSSSRGLNLMVVNISGKCARSLTELPGDELEPSFSNDGKTLIFTYRHKGTSVIAKLPFGSPESLVATCS